MFIRITRKDGQKSRVQAHLIRIIHENEDGTSMLDLGNGHSIHAKESGRVVEGLIDKAFGVANVPNVTASEPATA